MESLQRASATLLVLGDNLVPDELTALLGVQPNLGAKKGETFRASGGKDIEARISNWTFGGDWRNPPDVDRQIAELLLALPSDTELWIELTSRFDAGSASELIWPIGQAA
jgi:hypothetical protein